MRAGASGARIPLREDILQLRGRSFLLFGGMFGEWLGSANYEGSTKKEEAFRPREKGGARQTNAAARIVPCERRSRGAVSSNRRHYRKKTDDRQPGSHHAAPPPGGNGWTGMLGGTSRPTNPDYEPDGIFLSGRGSSLTGRDEPDPVTSRLA